VSKGQQCKIYEYASETREIMGIAKQENQMNFQFILCILDSYYIAQAII